VGTIFGVSQVVVAHPDGSQPHTASPSGNLTDLAWSPDGTRIAYVSSGGEGGAGAIYAMNADGSGRFAVVQPNSGQYLSELSWSPEGEWIAYASGVGTSINGLIQYGILAVPSAGGSPVKLSSGIGDDLAPAWSPDGRHIAFMRMLDHGGDSKLTSQLMVMKADGSGVTTLARLDTVTTIKPAWSPDGRMLAYLDGPRLMVIDPDGTVPRQLYRCTPACAVGGVSWSPDGSMLSVTQGIGQESTIVVLGTDGSGAHVLIQDACCLSWQPVDSDSRTGTASAAD
jgi:Tol biopolymer transport system component